MPTVVQFRRGTTEQNNNFTGAAGEISIDSTIDTIRVHDGATQGGFPLVNTTSSQTLANKTYSGVSVNVTGNVTGGNLVTAGVVTATGNITGGNLTTAGITDTGSLTASTTIAATGNVTGGNLVTAGVVTATGNITGGNLATAGVVTAAGNITGSYILGNGSQLTGIDATSIQSGTSSMSVIASGGNIRANIGGATIINITSGGIENGQANGVGNIGTSTTYFNTVFAKATSAQYADVAERYLADADYPVGTVLVFGGSYEVTQSQIDHTTAVAGTVSDKPAYVMNTGLEGDYVATVALLGRVPVRVIGTIRPGDLLVASELPGIATSMVKDRYAPGCVIGKALESYDSQREGVIEAVVGRL